MTIDPNTVEVKNNLEKHRFEIVLGDKTAFVDYMIAGKNIIFTHTEVPPEYEGTGLGSRLARAALDYAQAEGYKVQAICPFISAYIRRHPEYQANTWG